MSQGEPAAATKHAERPDGTHRQLEGHGYRRLDGRDGIAQCGSLLEVAIRLPSLEGKLARERVGDLGQFHVLRE